MPKLKQECFVIMPFSQTTPKHTSEYWTKHYESFLKPLIETKHSLIANRSSPLRGDIIKQIITKLVTVPVVVADITDANANVYWELGVRQSFKHGTVTIAEVGTEIPFDLGVKGTIFYFPNNHLKMPEFIQRFHIAIDDCLANPNLPDSHVLETISGRGTLHQIIIRDESLRKIDALLSEVTENKSSLDDTIKACEINTKIREAGKADKSKLKDIEFPSVRFRLLALEALIVYRYIDAEPEFYETLENCITWLMSANDLLFKWHESPITVEHWIMKSHEKIEERLYRIIELATEQKKRLKAVL